MVISNSFPNNFVPLNTAKELIIDAFSRFDPALGERARNILVEDARRLRIVDDVPPGLPERVMCCRPAGLTEEDLKSADMYIEDYRERFGDPFDEQKNPEEFAIIDFQYDGTIDSLVYLAHEVGHAIADDEIREAGYVHQDTHTDIHEKQAYFAQTILYTRIADNPDAPPEIVRGVQDHFRDLLASSIDGLPDNIDSGLRTEDFLSGVAILQVAEEQDDSERRHISLSLLGAHGPKTSADIREATNLNELSAIKSRAENTLSTLSEETLIAASDDQALKAAVTQKI